MLLRRLLLALSLTIFAGCSTPPPRVPVAIPPPPAVAMAPCQTPAPLAEGSTGRDLAEWAAAWVGAAGCERAKRQTLLEAWPR